MCVFVNVCQRDGDLVYTVMVVCRESLKYVSTSNAGPTSPGRLSEREDDVMGLENHKHE